MKLPGWEQRLEGLLEAARAADLDYDQWDCCRLAARAVDLQMGTDLAEQFQRQYSSLHGALRVLADQGGLRGMVCRLLGDPLPPLLAARGDIVAIPSGDPRFPMGLGVCTGHQVATIAPAGFVLHDLGVATECWKVG